MYRLGIIGLGHWFERLYFGIKETNKIKVHKAASISGLEKKRDQLTKYNIPESQYYHMIPGKPIPNGFFDDIDIVHISNPNQFHAEQTITSLENNKATITEKTLGVNKREFTKVLDYVTKNKKEKKLYLHLHYIHKLLVMELPQLLENLSREQGQIVNTSATFFQEVNEAGHRRSSWLFKPESGGLFMDWIHPFEVYYKGALAKTMKLNQIESYVVNADYDRNNPTGIFAEIGLSGRFFKNGARGSIRISEGVESQFKRKRVRFYFESKNYLDLNFLSSETEYTTDQRGSWELKNKSGEIIDSGSPSGPTSSDILVGDMVELCIGNNLGLSVDEIKDLYEPQWDYQKRSGESELISNKDRVLEFLTNGMNNSV